MRLPQRSSKAFTLIELIVVIVILGILALIAIPTFGKVVGKSQDESALSSLRAMARNAQALKAMDQASAWGSLPADSIGEVNTAAGAGIQAAVLTAVVDDGKTNPASGQVSYKVTDDNVVFSMLSGSKRICLVGATSTSVGKGKCVDAGKDATGAVTTSSAAAVFSSDTSVLPPSPTSVQAPSAPSSVSASATPGGAKVTWVASSATSAPVTGYRITAVPSSGTTVTMNVAASALSADLQLTAGLTYSVSVEASYSEGYSVKSAAVSVVPLSAGVAPATPTFGTPTFTNKSGENATLTVTWSPVNSTAGASVTGYRLYEMAYANGSWNTVSLVSDTSTTTYTKSIKYGFNACYKVSAYGPGGESPLSSHVCPQYIQYQEDTYGSSGVSPVSVNGRVWSGVGTWSNVSLTAAGGTVALITPGSEDYMYYNNLPTPVINTTYSMVFNYVDPNNYWRSAYTYNGTKRVYNVLETSGGTTTVRYSYVSDAGGSFSGPVMAVKATANSTVLKLVGENQSYTIPTARPAGAKVGFGSGGTYVTSYLTYGYGTLG